MNTLKGENVRPFTKIQEHLVPVPGKKVVPGKNYRKVIWCNKMKIISIAAVTAGGKTTIVNELKKQIPNTKSLHFDEYSVSDE